MTTIRGEGRRPWTEVHKVTINNRSVESIQSILRIAAERLTTYMTETGDGRDEGTIALIVELDRLASDIY
jgi:hypothetical protein